MPNGTPIKFILKEDGKTYSINEFISAHAPHMSGSQVRHRYMRAGKPKVATKQMLTFATKHGGQNELAVVIVLGPGDVKPLTFNEIASVANTRFGCALKGHSCYKIWDRGGRPKKVWIADFDPNSRAPKNSWKQKPRSNGPVCDLMGLSDKENTGAGRGEIDNETWIAGYGRGCTSGFGTCTFHLPR